MKKTFSLSAAQAALLIVLINNEYSFGTSIDTQILSFGPIPQPSEKKYPLEVDKEEIQNILSVLGIANDDDELSEKHDDINELSLFFVNSEFQDAKEELTEVAETEQVTLTAEEMTVVCMLHITHGLLGLLADAVTDAMDEFKEGIPPEAGEFVVEDITEINAVDIITTIYEAEKNKAFAEYLPVLDNLKDKFAQFCEVVPEPREEWFRWSETLFHLI